MLRDQTLIERWFRDIASQDAPGSEEQWNVFYGLDRVAGEFRDRHPLVRAEYLLNSVESIRVAGEEMIVTGVCSKRVPGGR
ncbi:hypothetical protein [Streptomyces griseosporeus]|uniref:hypothetical protein n=1 Tax=Streptomyces griseosporeus TaxID=1910 RepID=UPI0036F67BBD